MYSQKNENAENNMQYYVKILPDNDDSQSTYSSLNSLLPDNDDSQSTYSGLISFTSNQSVNFLIQHNVDLNKQTVSKNLLNEMIFAINEHIPSTIIKPNYDNNLDLFSTSLSFVGHAIFVTDDDPFFIVYSVSATKEKNQNSSKNNIAYDNANNDIPEDSVDPSAPVATYVGPQLLLGEVLRVLDDNLLKQLPLEQLAVDDLLVIINKLPSEKGKLVFNKLSEIQKQQIKEKLTDDKFNSLMTK